MFITPTENGLKSSSDFLPFSLLASVTSSLSVLILKAHNSEQDKVAYIYSQSSSGGRRIAMGLKPVWATYGVQG